MCATSLASLNKSAGKVESKAQRPPSLTAPTTALSTELYLHGHTQANLNATTRHEIGHSQY